jgi:hypothetical protein
MERISVPAGDNASRHIEACDDDACAPDTIRHSRDYRGNSGHLIAPRHGSRHPLSPGPRPLRVAAEQYRQQRRTRDPLCLPSRGARRRNRCPSLREIRPGLPRYGLRGASGSRRVTLLRAGTVARRLGLRICAMPSVARRGIPGWRLLRLYPCLRALGGREARRGLGPCTAQETNADENHE